MMYDVMTSTRKEYNIKKLSDKMIRDELNQFEDAFPNGAYTVPHKPKDPFLKVAALRRYCRDKGLDYEKLTKEQLEPFYAYPNK